jgi:hypothetical protein
MKELAGIINRATPEALQSQGENFTFRALTFEPYDTNQLN